jgi:hypothetical protein
MSVPILQGKLSKDNAFNGEESETLPQTGPEALAQH